MRKRLRSLSLGFSALLLASCALAGEARSPDEVDGLEAWYQIETVHAQRNDGEVVSTWKDSSGNGHHLLDERNGVRAILQIKQVNGKPAVLIRKGNTHAVAVPFTLDDHAIFLVYRSDYTSRALFQSDEDESRGLLLRTEERLNQYQNGGPEYMQSYNTRASVPAGFSVTVLTRGAGLLGCFVNGLDVSTRNVFSDPIRVGRFFALKHTQFARSDGDGLHIAEMIFYRRDLSRQERNGVTRYLADKYAIDVQLAEPPSPAEAAPPAAPAAADPKDYQAWLSTRAETDLNTSAVAIPWGVVTKLEAPFRHDAAKEPTRLYCTRDAAAVEVYLRLPVASRTPGTSLRVLILKNGQEYQTAKEASGPILAPDGQTRATLAFETTLALRSGDYIEVIASGTGGPGPVTPEADGAAFAARVRP